MIIFCLSFLVLYSLKPLLGWYFTLGCGKPVLKFRCLFQLYQVLTKVLNHTYQLFIMSQQVSHGAIQFTAYEELRKVIVDFKSKRSTVHNQNPDKLLVS